MLTNQQIQDLYRFCEKKGVRYYDLQSELVDHLTESIGEKQKVNAEMSFEDALMHAYGEFGISGFSQVIAEREDALSKNYYRTRWIYFKSYFTYPKVLITVLICLVLNVSPFVLKINDLENYYSAITISAGIFGLVLWLFAVKSFKKPAKKLIALNHYRSGCNIWWMAIQAPNLYFLILHDWSSDFADNLWHHILLCCFVATLIILSLAEYDAYKKTYIHLRKQYPLAFTPAD